MVHAGAADVGRRLGDVIARRLNLARGEAERRTMAGLVSVHGNACLDPDRRVRSGDVIHARGGDSAPNRAKSPRPSVVHRDGDLLIVDKPAGVTSVREPGDRGRGPGRDPSPTLDELLNDALGQAVRPVHRLDRDTSGLMAFALSPAAASRLSADFKAHRIGRAYRAVVRGRFESPQTFDSLLVRDRGDGKRGSLPAGVSSPDARRAVTHARPVENLGDAYTVIECELETGRTHQIRIHLSEAGHPLCGDREYGRRGDRSSAPRQALHAFKLALDHPTTNRPLSFESDWPADLRRWLDSLRSARNRSSE